MASVVASWCLGMLALGGVTGVCRFFLGGGSLAREGVQVGEAGLRGLDEKGVQVAMWRVEKGCWGNGGGGGEGWLMRGGGNEGVKLVRLRTALDTIKLYPQNSFGE